MQHILGNALDWAEKDGYCMIHVCNNKGGFGGGKTAIATQVKERFSAAYHRYMINHELGAVTNDAKNGSLNVCNLVAQDGYGPRWKKIKYFKEEAFIKCLEWLVSDLSIHVMKEMYGIHTIVVPYKMGADRAGGDWDWIICKVEEYLGKHYELLIVEYDN